MAFYFEGITFLILLLTVQGVPLGRPLWHKQKDETARNIVNPLPTTAQPFDVASTFVFLNQSDIDQGLDYLKQKYPNIDWTALTNTPHPTSGGHTNTKTINSTFVFLNQSDIDKGLEFLKKKYPNVDWTIVTSQTSGKREFENSLERREQVTSTFFFLNQSDIDKGLAFLMKKYPNVNWTLVAPQISEKREWEGMEYGETENNNIDESLNASLEDLLEIKGRNEIAEENKYKEKKSLGSQLSPDSTFDFLPLEDDSKNFPYLKENIPHID